MHAVWYDRQGPANEVLVYGELPTPEPGNYEVRVRLEASGVNPSDTYRRRGPAPAMEYPRVITSSDGAGVVDAVGRWCRAAGSASGSGCTTASATAAGWAPRQNTSRWTSSLVTELPDHVSFAEGATLGIPCMTAHGCVFVAGPVQGRSCWSPAGPEQSATTRCSLPSGLAQR